MPKLLKQILALIPEGRSLQVTIDECILHPENTFRQELQKL
jgi:hypothetical protein